LAKSVLALPQSSSGLVILAVVEELERRIRGAEGEWWFRHTVSQDLPGLATDALVAGWDGQSLRVLAGEPSDTDHRDLGDLFEKAVLELGRERLTGEQAFRRFVAYLAWLMVSRQVSVLDGVQRIERIPWYDAPELDALGHLAFVADEWGAGWGRPVAELEVDALRLASELLAQLDADDPLPSAPSLP
jgi:hypothetical protein